MGTPGRSKKWFIGGTVMLAVMLVPTAIVAGTDFDDVPASSGFYDDIQWLAESGVTQGCASGRFCPDDFVTREQMAAFMRRLAGGNPAIAAASVDAATVQGMTADELMGGGSGQLRTVGAYLVDTATELPSEVLITSTITAPVEGFLVLGGSLSVQNTSEETVVLCGLDVGDATGDGNSYTASLRLVDLRTAVAGNCASDMMVPVGAGTHEVALDVVTSLDPDTSTEFLTASLTATFIPGWDAAFRGAPAETSMNEALDESSNSR